MWHPPGSLMSGLRQSRGLLGGGSSGSSQTSWAFCCSWVSYQLCRLVSASFSRRGSQTWQRKRGPWPRRWQGPQWIPSQVLAGCWCCHGNLHGIWASEPIWDVFCCRMRGQQSLGLVSLFPWMRAWDTPMLSYSSIPGAPHQLSFLLPYPRVPEFIATLHRKDLGEMGLHCLVWSRSLHIFKIEVLYILLYTLKFT